MILYETKIKKLSIEAKHLKEDKENITKKLERARSDLKIAENVNLDLEIEIEKIKGERAEVSAFDYENLKLERSKLDHENKTLKSDNSSLKQQIK